MKKYISFFFIFLSSQCFSKTFTKVSSKDFLDSSKSLLLTNEFLISKEHIDNIQGGKELNYKKIHRYKDIYKKLTSHLIKDELEANSKKAEDIREIANIHKFFKIDGVDCEFIGASLLSPRNGQLFVISDEEILHMPYIGYVSAILDKNNFPILKEDEVAIISDEGTTFNSARFIIIFSFAKKTAIKIPYSQYINHRYSNTELQKYNNINLISEYMTNSINRKRDGSIEIEGVFISEFNGANDNEKRKILLSSRIFDTNRSIKFLIDSGRTSLNCPDLARFILMPDKVQINRIKIKNTL